MRNHLISVGLGLGMVTVGLVLWLATGDINTPVVSLSKIGIVLVVLGGSEVVISTIALMVPSTRHRGDPL